MRRKSLIVGKDSLDLSFESAGLGGERTEGRETEERGDGEERKWKTEVQL